MNIKNGANKVKNFVKENWKGIAIGAGTVALGAVGIRYGKQLVASRKVERLPIPENWELGKMTWFSKDPTGNVVGIVDIPRSNLASLGESLTNLDIDEKFDKVAVLAAFTDKVVEN